MRSPTKDDKKRRPLKILHIIDSVDPERGGAIESIVQQALNADSDQFVTTVVSLDLPGSRYIEKMPMEVIPLGQRTSNKRSWNRLLPWVHYRYSELLIPWLRSHVQFYDIVVVDGIWNYSTFAARWVLKGGRVPYVVFPHGMLDPWFKKNFPVKSKLKQLVWWLCEGPLLRGANGVFFASENERLLARDAFWPYSVKERVVSLGTSDVHGSPEEQSAKFRSQLPNLRDRNYLLFLSRIHPKKGCDDLIEAFAAVSQRYPDIDLVMAGPDPQGWRKSLQRRSETLGLRDRIHWPGMLSGDAKWGAYRGAIAFVLPSHQENFGLVVAEAMAVGRPVIITNKVNIWQKIKECSAGLVGTDGAPGITALLLSFLALSQTAKDQMGANARRCFLSNYEMTKVVQEINRALAEVLQCSRSGE